jgi:cystathionine beta-synthase
VYTRKIALEGDLVGNSAESMWELCICKNFKPEDVVVFVFIDSGSRYVGKMFNDDDARGFLRSQSPRLKMSLRPHR